VLKEILPGGGGEPGVVGDGGATAK